MSKGVPWLWRFLLTTFVAACVLSFISHQLIPEIDDPETTRWDIGILVWSLSLLCGIFVAYRRR
jgi:hypothetical protein